MKSPYNIYIFFTIFLMATLAPPSLSSVLAKSTSAPAPAAKSTSSTASVNQAQRQANINAATARNAART